MNRHIAIIDHVGSKAGMDYYSSSLARGFIMQDYDCTVYSNFKGIDVNTINYKLYFDGHNKHNPFVKFIKFISATTKASFQARKNNVNLVILHLFSANIITLLLIMIPKLLGLKTAIISHDVSSFIDNDNSRMQNLIYNVFSDYIIVHNQFSHDELLKNIKLNNPKKVSIIKHGGYLDHICVKLDKVNVRKELELDVEGKYILFFGQIKEVKGLDILLEAMSKVSPNIKLIIAGKPWKADFSKYDALIEKYDLSDRIIKIIRFIEDDEREKLFFSADVNVLPYRTIYQSGVLLMAMSYGLSVIASDLPANKEIINDGENGMLFISEDSDDLVDKINNFFHNKTSQMNMADNALKTIEDNYSWDYIAKQYIEILRS